MRWNAEYHCGSPVQLSQAVAEQISTGFILTSDLKVKSMHRNHTCTMLLQTHKNRGMKFFSTSLYGKWGLITQRHQSTEGKNCPGLLSFVTLETWAGKNVNGLVESAPVRINYLCKL